MTEFILTCDRPCMTLRGLLITVGTRVTYLSRDPGIAKPLLVRMEDGSQEEVASECFRQWRALEEFKGRAVHAIMAMRMAYNLPHIRAAVEALPDRAKLSWLPGDVRMFIETNLALIKGDS
jgi:hypothetical protein